ncbi:hypothetical protein [Terricaulis sp.]|uniref:hypothetical protein n=1 Tax=Terricaulis sp. TaxID=2768686 RepID=UPI0037843754
MKVFILIFGAAAALLGGLWLLQGLGLVHLRPILCFADCTPLEGPSLTWTVLGFVLLLAGAFTLLRARRWRR